MKMGRIDWKTMNTQAQKILDNLELEIDATQELENYSVAIQQMVAIARAVDIQSKVSVSYTHLDVYKRQVLEKRLECSQSISKQKIITRR